MGKNISCRRFFIVAVLVIYNVLLFVTPSLAEDGSPELKAYKPKVRPQEYYENTIKSHSKTFVFAERTVKQGADPAYFNSSGTSTLTDALFLGGGLYSSYKANESLNGLGIGGGFSSGLMALDAITMLGTFTDIFSTNKAMKVPIQKFKSLVEVVYWDPHILDATILLDAERELITDIHSLLAYRKNLYTQFPVEESLIFQIRIHNQETRNIQLQPFTWHIFLEDFQGNRHKMLKYDPQLDSIIRPGQYIEGFVYFSRRDLNSGQIIAPAGNSVKLILEEFNGKHGILEFT